jgi:hypothetical protein
MLTYNHKRFYSRTSLEFCCNFGSSHRFRRIKVYPKGNAEAKGDSLSVFLELVDGDKLPPKKTVWAEYKLRVLDQRHGKHVEQKSNHIGFLLDILECMRFFYKK